MNPKSMVLTLIALVCGMSAAFMVARLKPPAPDAEAPAADGLVRVVVAARDLCEGLTLAEPEKVLKVVHYRKGDEPKGFHSDAAALKDRVLSRPVNADQPVKDDDLRK